MASEVRKRGRPPDDHEEEFAFNAWVFSDKSVVAAHEMLKAEWPETWSTVPSYHTLCSWVGRYNWHEKADALQLASWPEHYTQIHNITQKQIPLVLREAIAIIKGDRDHIGGSLLKARVSMIDSLLKHSGYAGVMTMMNTITGGLQLENPIREAEFEILNKTPMELAEENARMIDLDRQMQDRQHIIEMKARRIAKGGRG